MDNERRIGLGDKGLLIMTFRYRSDSPDCTLMLGKKIGQVLKGGDVLAFRGGLGAGKTAMTRGIAIGMGLKDEVCSPTFAIVNEYPGSPSLAHFDMYRICGEADLESIGFYDYLSDERVIAIEWSENISELLPAGTVTVTIDVTGDETRDITIEGDERFDFA